MKAENDFNFGALFASYLKTNKISKAALARAIDRNDNAILYFQKKNSVQASIIVELCHALKHNFFMDIAYQLPKEYATSAQIDTSKEEKIAQLEHEIALLKAREEVLLKAFGKG
jgi:hypothetical protein